MELELVASLVALIKAKSATKESLCIYKEVETENSHKQYLRQKMLFECAVAEYEIAFEEWYNE